MAWPTKRILSREYYAVPVATRHTDLALLVCSLTTGIIDSVSFENWAVFVGMQTGNTVILGLSTARLPITQSISFASTLVSLASFLLGVFISATASRGYGMTRLKVTLLFLVQSLLVALSATLCSIDGLVPTDLSGAGSASSARDQLRLLIAIPPLAFQSGVQIASSRILGFNELPVNVLTSSYADVMGDANLWARHNPKRNRRVGGMVGVLLGAICAAWMMRSGVAVGPILWLAAGLKGVVVLGCLVGLQDEPMTNL